MKALHLWTGASAILCSVLFFILLAVTVEDFMDKPRAGSTLTKVFIVFRHGSKSPAWMYKGDPYRQNYSAVWPEGPGSLTKILVQRGSLAGKNLLILQSDHNNQQLFCEPPDGSQGKVNVYEYSALKLGKEEMYELGKKLRGRYDSFLGPYYKDADVAAHTLKVNRTQMSLQLFLASFFPPHGYQVWSKELDWQPIPIDSNFILSEQTGLKCSRFVQEEKENFHKLVGKIVSKYPNAFSILRANSGEDNPVWMGGRVWDAVSSQSGANLPIPQWLKPIFPRPLNEIAYLLVEAFYLGTDVLKRLTLRDYIGMLEDFFNSQKKVEIIAWHDVNMIIFVTLLGMRLPSYPDPSSCLVIELHEEDQQKYFEVFYYTNSTAEVPIRLELPCGLKCTEDSFTKVIETYKVDKYEALCSSGNITNVTIHVVDDLVAPADLNYLYSDL